MAAPAPNKPPLNGDGDTTPPLAAADSDAETEAVDEVRIPPPQFGSPTRPDGRAALAPTPERPATNPRANCPHTPPANAAHLAQMLQTMPSREYVRIGDKRGAAASIRELTDRCAWYEQALTQADEDNAALVRDFNELARTKNELAQLYLQQTAQIEALQADMAGLNARFRRMAIVLRDTIEHPIVINPQQQPRPQAQEGDAPGGPNAAADAPEAEQEQDKNHQQQQ